MHKALLPYRERLQSFLKTDRAILILSIGIAFVLWFVTKMTQKYETQRSIHLEYELPKGKTFANTPPTTTVATIKSGGWNLLFSTMRGMQKSVRFKLEDKENSTISASNIRSKIASKLGSKYEVTDVNVELITLQLDQGSIRDIPVQLDLDIQYAQGYMPSDSLVYIPNTIQISGAKKWVDALEHYPTKRLELRDISVSFSKKIALKDALNQQVKITPKEVVVHQKIEKYTEGEVLVPIEIISKKDSVSILPNNVFITYRAPLSIFRNISPNDFKVVAKLSENRLGHENNTLALEVVSAPPFSKLVRLNPPSIQYFVVEKEH